MKIVMLDRNSIGFDIDVDFFANLGEFEHHNTTDVETSKKLIMDAEVVIFNKTKMNEEMLQAAPNVKLLCVTATGFDNIDLEYAKKRGIAACNIKDYSTPAVVQHTFALALSVLEKLNYYDDYVKSGAYSNQLGFSHFEKTYFELQGKTWGIIGLGNIGKGVAKVAEAFGCKVIFYSASGSNSTTDYERVDFDTLCRESDILSLHCPLSDKTREIMNLDAFRKMKKTAILINVARGPVINENDLYTALTEGLIGGAGLDVLSKEPMEKTNPLAQIKDSDKLIITPHMAWASVEARTRCMEEVYKNIEAFVNGEIRNRLDL
ncbi:MAG: D-2-hydroxyacid dehydrogenase [Lachnospiraceae bacterium]|nr:D-2-hydroxyacid dehydrogenase [Lachnospiraceae bacterium]